MNWKAVLFGITVLILLVVLMLYSGMFMYGDR